MTLFRPVGMCFGTFRLLKVESCSKPRFAGRHSSMSESSWLEQRGKRFAVTPQQKQLESGKN